MRIGQRSAINFTSQLTASVIGFAVTVYLARELGSELLGVYFLVIAVVIWLKILGGMGVQSALNKRLSERGDSERYLTAGLILQAAMFIGIVVILFLVRDPLDEYLRGVGVAVLVPLLFTTLALSFVTSALDGFHLVHISSLLSPLDRLLRGLLQVGAVVLGYAVVGLLVGYAIAAILTAIVGIALLPGRLELPSRRHFRQLLSFARYSWINSLSTRAFTSMDTIVLGLFVGSGLIGIYEIAWNLASILAVFAESITRTLFPELSRLSSADRLDTVAIRVTDGVQYTGLLLFPGLIGAVAVGDRVLAIYGAEFVRGYTILLILIAARMLYAFASQFVSALNAIDRPELGFRINGGFVVSNVALNLVLVWQFGWVGAAVATAVSATLAFVLSFRAASKLLGVQLPITAIREQIMAAVAMGAIVYLVQGYLPRSAIVTVVLVLGGAAMYGATLFGISPTFRTTVRENLVNVWG